MKFTVAVASALLSTGYASCVQLATTPCISSSNLEQFDVPIINGSDAPTVQALNGVCGIKIVSVSDDVDINSVQCQAFKDAAGTQLGSALFSYASPALIATNPVEEGSIRCVIAPTVQIESTPCIQPDNSPAQQYTVPLSVASNRTIVQAFNNICGLKITSASSDVDVNSIQCQAFKDQSGEQPGSAVFTYANPALIATNPVEEQSIRCTIGSGSSSKKMRRFRA